MPDNLPGNLPGRRSDFPFRGIVEQSLAGIYVIQDEVFEYVNATFAAIAGYRPAEMVGMHLSQLVPPESLAEVIDNYHRRISGEVPSIRFLTQGLHRSGHTVQLEVHGSRMIYRGRPAVAGVGIDITEQVRQHAELHASRERLSELTQYINTVREEQRRHFARELHDVVGGMLTSIKLGVQRIERRVEGDELRAIVADLKTLTQETIDAVRDISECLRPGVLDHLGLVAALRALLQDFSERTGTAAELSPQDLELNLSQSRATAIYRICQEALTNITRHASARRVDFCIASEGGMLRLEIRDDGCGIPSPTPVGKRIGLTSMSERARELGGDIEIGSPAEGGTRLLVSVPLEARS